MSDDLVKELRDVRPMPWDDDIADACNRAATLIEAQAARIAELEAEALENARIIGASGEREAAHLARIAELDAAIKLQAAAVRTLHHNEQTEINVLRRKSSEAHCAIMALDSERAVNAILTDELDAARATIRRLQNDLQAHKDALAQSEPKP